MQDHVSTSAATLSFPDQVSDDDKNTAMLLHLVTIGVAVFTAGLGDILVPAVAYVLLGNRSAFVKDHIREQLNFQLTFLAVSVAAVVLAVMTFGIGLIVAVPVLAVLWIADIVCSVVAALRARDGLAYAFPFTIRFLK